MSEFDYAQFAHSMGDFYQQVGRRMGDYLQNNITAMAADPGRLRVFYDEQSRINSYANTFYALSDQIAFAGADIYFKSVTDATASLNAAIQKIDGIDKWINFSAAVITLGTSIVSKNGTGILSSVQTIRNTFAPKPPGAPAVG